MDLGAATMYAYCEPGRSYCASVACGLAFMAVSTAQRTDNNKNPGLRVSTNEPEYGRLDSVYA